MCVRGGGGGQGSQENTFSILGEQWKKPFWGGPRLLVDNSSKVQGHI